MYLKIFQLQSLVNLGFIGFLFPVRCTPQKGFSRNLWAGIQIWVNQGGRSNVSVLPYCMTVVCVYQFLLLAAYLQIVKFWYHKYFLFTIFRSLGSTTQHFHFAFFEISLSKTNLWAFSKQFRVISTLVAFNQQTGAETAVHQTFVQNDLGFSISIS